MDSKIYKKNLWKGQDSLSGEGSDAPHVGTISDALPGLFNEFNITTLLDIPCGDFFWMKNVDLTGVEYFGADLVKPLVQENIKKYQKDRVAFQLLDLIKDDLPAANLVLVRDCLVHFSFADIFAALDNIRKSRSDYILTTTFTDRKNNHDILTGQFRPLNLEIAPFMFPKPIKIINEKCTIGDGAFGDKSLGLWKVADISQDLIG